MDVYRACGVLHGLEEGALEPLPLVESSPLRTRLQTYPPAQIAALQQVFGGWTTTTTRFLPSARSSMTRHFRARCCGCPGVRPGDPLRRFHPIVKRIADGRRAIVVSKEMAGWRGTKGFVANVAAAIARAAVSDRAAGRIYNVGERDTLTELEWLRLIAQQLGWSGEFVVLPEDRMPAHLRTAANFEQHWIADTTRLRQELGVEESIGRDEAIRLTVAWEQNEPPLGLTPHAFDYAAEDAALQVPTARES